MTIEEIIIAVVRVLGSLPVLIWPFPGAILAVLVDLSDLFMMNLLDAGGVSDYQALDKWLDQVYMLTFLIIALSWERTPRNIAIGLYAYRMIGFVAFEATGERAILIFFPNLFEFWFIFVAGVKFFRLDAQWLGQPAARGLVPYRYSANQLTLVLPLMLAAKLGQEFVLHVGKWLDHFTAVEAIQWLWRLVTPPY